MSRRYANPPIIEALCEFQFASETWDWTIPGIMYQEISDRFPKKRQARVLEFEVQAQARELNQTVRSGMARMQFLRADERVLVQVGQNLLAINHLQPYTHWDEFRPLVLEMLALYWRVAQPAGFQRIGLRYINQLEVPETGFDATKYFNFLPQVPDAINGPAESLAMRVEIAHEADNGQLLLSLGTLSRQSEASLPGFMLDLDFVTRDAAALTGETAAAWIEVAHARIESAFEACITDALREQFKEIEP